MSEQDEVIKLLKQIAIQTKPKEESSDHDHPTGHQTLTEVWNCPNCGPNARKELMPLVTPEVLKVEGPKIERVTEKSLRQKYGLFECNNPNCDHVFWNEEEVESLDKCPECGNTGAKER